MWLYGRARALMAPNAADDRSADSGRVRGLPQWSRGRDDSAPRGATVLGPWRVQDLPGLRASLRRLPAASREVLERAFRQNVLPRVFPDTRDVREVAEASRRVQHASSTRPGR